MTANETKLDASMLDEVDDPSLFMQNGWFIAPPSCGAILIYATWNWLDLQYSQRFTLSTKVPKDKQNPSFCPDGSHYQII